MNRIISPVGKPVKRISVDIDIQGQVSVTGVQKGPLGQSMPMTMFEVACVLSNVVASTLLGMAGKIPMQTKASTVKPHTFSPKDEKPTDCQLCGENELSECHKGEADGSEETTH